MIGASRCASTSELRDEALVGTASTVTRFLLLEVPGAWGREILTDAHVSDELKAGLRERSRRHRLRVLFIRRYGRHHRETKAPVRCFVASTRTGAQWVEAASLDRAEDVLDLQLSGVGSAQGVGLTPHRAPLFLVCTHGRHDVCCAERGRPLARSLSEELPEQTWECSHIGGDRFAGNLMILPDGLYYGRADAITGPQIVREHLAGRLDLAHLRGSTGLSFPAQAAEWELRSQLGLRQLSGLTLLTETTDGSHTTASFAQSDGPRWRVVVETTHAPEHYLTCARVRLHAAPRFSLVSLDQEI